MKKILSAVIMFCVMIFSANCQAKDIYLGETLEGTYWAISESFEHFIDEWGCEADFCEIDFKIVPFGEEKYKIHHCLMWSSGDYVINDGIKEDAKKSPHPMYNLYQYTLKRING